MPGLACIAAKKDSLGISGHQKRESDLTQFLMWRDRQTIWWWNHKSYCCAKLVTRQMGALEHCSFDYSIVNEKARDDWTKIKYLRNTKPVISLLHGLPGIVHRLGLIPGIPVWTKTCKPKRKKINKLYLANDLQGLSSFEKQACLATC